MEKMAKIRLSDHYKTTAPGLLSFLVWGFFVGVLVFGLGFFFFIPRNKGTTLKSLALRWKWAYLSLCIN